MSKENKDLLRNYQRNIIKNYISENFSELVFTYDNLILDKVGGKKKKRPGNQKGYLMQWNHLFSVTWKL